MTVLDLLRKSGEGYVSGEDMSKTLKVSRSAVWKEIQSLRTIGYDIQAQPHLGYRLAGVPDKMFSDEIAYGLKTRFMGKKIFSYDELDSTNDTVFKLGEQGFPEGTCAFTEHQKKGRGRMGRAWISPKSRNVLFSYLLRPRVAPSDVSRITLITAVSVVKVIREHTGETFGIKWPNDIVYDDKKAGGILTEMSAEADRVNFIVVGIGLNVNSALKDLPPASTSLKAVCGKEISRVKFAQDLLAAIEEDYLRLKEGDFEGLSKDWEDLSATTGRRVSATLLDRTIQGQATGIDKDGALWIRKDNGLQERILAGDIQHLRPSADVVRPMPIARDKTR